VLGFPSSNGPGRSPGRGGTWQGGASVAAAVPKTGETGRGNRPGVPGYRKSEPRHSDQAYDQACGAPSRPRPSEASTTDPHVIDGQAPSPRESRSPSVPLIVRVTPCTPPVAALLASPWKLASHRRFDLVLYVSRTRTSTGLISTLHCTHAPAAPLPFCQRRASPSPRASTATPAPLRALQTLRSHCVCLPPARFQDLPGAAFPSHQP
jgi:hypothetical protein